jgi:hypothetical protein
MSKKETYYFSHDYNARSDEKIIELIMVHGMQGYGIYWSIIENLYNNANALQTHYKRIAFELRVSEDMVKSVVNDFNLFTIDGEIFFSKSVSERLEKRTEISEKARESAKKRWQKDANAMRPHTERNATAMQKKGKEIKEKESKELKPRKIRFEDSELFDKFKFKDNFPEWSKEKLTHYYDAALRYSIEGNKYVSWKLAIQTWERKDAANKVVIDKPKEKVIIW